MKKLFFIILLSTIFINADSVDAFDNAIKEFKFNYYLNGNTLTFDNLENNETQRELKARFEKIIPYFLALDGLFSKERMEAWHEHNMIVHINKPREEVIGADMTSERMSEDELRAKEDFFEDSLAYYSSFYKVLNVYLKYLKTHPNSNNHKLFSQLSHKALHEFLELSKNSVTLEVGVLAYYFVKELYITIENKEILRQHPPLEDETLLYKKILAQKRDTLRRLEPINLHKLSSWTPNEKMTPLEQERLPIIYDFTKKKLDEYYAEYIELLKNDSTEELAKMIDYHTKPWEHKELLEPIIPNTKSYKFYPSLFFDSNIHVIHMFLEKRKELLVTYKKLMDEKVETKESYIPWYLYLIYGMLGLFVIYLMSILFGILKWFYMKLTQ